MFNACRPRAAIERIAGDGGIQHNPHVATGKDGFIDYFERMAREYPGKQVEIRTQSRGGGLVVRRFRQIWQATSNTPGSISFVSITRRRS